MPTTRNTVCGSAQEYPRIRIENAVSNAVIHQPGEQHEKERDGYSVLLVNANRECVTRSVRRNGMRDERESDD